MTTRAIQRIQFFDCGLARDDVGNLVLQNLYFNCCSAGCGLIALGHPTGKVSVYDRSFQETVLDVSTGPVIHVRVVGTSVPILVAVAEDVPGGIEVVYVVRVDRTASAQSQMGTSPPAPSRAILRELRPFAGWKTLPPKVPLRGSSLPPGGVVASSVTAITMTDALDTLVLGLSDGTALLYRCDIRRDRSPKPRIIGRPGEGGPVSLCAVVRSAVLIVRPDGLLVVRPPPAGGPAQEPEYDVTFRSAACLAAVSASGPRGAIPRLTVVSAGGLALHDGHGPAGVVPLDVATERATHVFWHGSVVGLILPRTGGTTGPEGGHDAVALFDLTHRLRALTMTLPGRVVAVVSTGARAFLFVRTTAGAAAATAVSSGGDGSVFTGGGMSQSALVTTSFAISERDHASKLRQLMDLNMYDMARQLAASPGFDPGAVADVYSKEGDHAFEEGDLVRAVRCYVRTIGRLEPSEVLRKFLFEGSAQRLEHLPPYLEELHRQHLATPEHTRLLLHILGKLRKPHDMARFLFDPQHLGTYDPATAVRLCRRAKCFEIAVAVADVHGRASDVVSIQLLDRGRYREVVEFIRSLPLTDAADLLLEHGRVLADHAPDATTDALCAAVTEWVPWAREPAPLPYTGDVAPTVPRPSSAQSGATEGEGGRRRVLPSQYIGVFGHRRRHQLRFLECVVHNKVHTDESAAQRRRIDTVMLDLYVAPTLGSSSDPPERNFFVEDPPPAVSDDGPSTTSVVDEDSPADREARLSKAMVLLQDPTAQFDDDAAMMSCVAANFRPGLLALYERRGMYDLVLETHVAAGDAPQVVAAAMRLTPRDPDAWRRVLAFLVERHASCDVELAEALAHVELHTVLQPLDVVRLLASSSRVPVAAAADYLTRALTRDLCIVESLESRHRTLSRRHAELSEALRTARGRAQQVGGGKCAICHRGIDNPTVHFLCKHSFHVACLQDQPRCPICAPVQHQILRRRAALQQMRADPEALPRALAVSTDPSETLSGPSGRDWAVDLNQNSERCRAFSLCPAHA
eukprot:TRINITY_DN5678_c0_g1_i2.p1 TRINITY_DN5678_c0_g1~~TRINITY_DN5678_c0_g1_i2.p1  ORF type:complete len:1029 (-),score=139.19 TRINITY_DN5678_c0_g1_i2:415-3501(-)